MEMLVQEPEALYRVEYVADVWDIGRTAVYALIQSGELRSIKIGGSRRIPASALAEYVAKQNEAA